MEEFLNFDRKNQDGFISNSMLMLGVIAAQTEPKIAQCLNEWYQGSDTIKIKRHDEILDAMQDLPQYVPTTIVLAVAERACGKFKRKE